MVPRKVLAVKVVVVIAAVLIFHAPLIATTDRICVEKDFQLVVAPEKRSFSRTDSITVHLAVTNRTQRPAWIAPHLYPFDYWVDQYSGGRWKPVGGFVPASRTRRDMPLGPRDMSEYRTLKSGETYSTAFVVVPEVLAKGGSGRYRIRVRAYAKQIQSKDVTDIGCAILGRPVQFSIK